MALVICAFTGSTRQDSNDIAYLNGPNFSKVEDYIEALQGNFSEEQIIVVPCAVRHALKELGMSYVVVFPSLGLKKEYLERYKDKATRDFMDKNWEDLICEIQTEDYSNRVILSKGKYIEDIIEVVKRVGYDFK